MKKSILLAVALFGCASLLEGYDFNALKSSLQDGMSKLKQVYQASKDYVQNQVLNPFDTKIMVYNIADSYSIKAGGVSIAPRTVQWVTAKRNGGSFTITAKDKKGASVGEPITYTRTSTEDVLEVDVGRAPAFPKIVDRATGKELVQKQSWMGGSMSTSVKIWTRALSLMQAQNGYNISY